MQRYDIYTKDDARILYEEDDEYGDWVKYETAAARISELEAQLAAAQERERWIPVTERLPEFSMQTKKCQVVIEAEFCGGEFYDKDGEWIREDVTHWRELPAPPEADHAAE